MEEIAVSVIAPATRDNAPNGHAVLVEVESLLDRLLATGKPGGIDLRAMPLGPTDMAYLRQALGQGEVTARVDVLGPTEIQETGIHGVWWVTHHNSEGMVIAEFLEITPCPDIVQAHRADMSDSLEALRGRMVTQ